MGVHLSKIFWSPPASRVIVPASTAGVEPEMATSSKSTLRTEASRCRRRDSSGDIVLISRMMVPGFADEKAPPLSKYTERTASSSAKEEMTKSESATSLSTDDEIVTPSRASDFAESGLRFHACTFQPEVWRR